jgi:hypothetical protein
MRDQARGQHYAAVHQNRDLRIELDGHIESEER